MTETLGNSDGPQESMELSVVIAGNEAAVPIGMCLRALAAQKVDSIEIIVAVGGSPETAAEARKALPSVDLIELSAPTSLAELRGRAIRRSKGRVIAILDPYAVPNPNWAEAVLESHRRHPNLIIGGVVGLYREEHASLWNWARYINEYGLLMPPDRKGPSWILAGCNITYKRAAIPVGGPFWKTFVNESQRAEGEDLLLDPDIRVELFKPVPTSDYLFTRYHHGRCYAGLRSQRRSPIERLARAATAPLVPLLLYWRLARAVWRKRRRRRKLLLTTPLHLLFYANWMLGEAVGYLFGPGRSCSRLHY